MSDERPTIYVTNWATINAAQREPRPPKTVGKVLLRREGHAAYTIMAKPTALRGECGDGRVPLLTPLRGWLDAVQNDDEDMSEEGRRRQAERERLYRCRCVGRFLEALLDGRLAPGALIAIGSGTEIPLVDGDVIACACAIEKATRGLCHRAWAADALVAAGWRVILDGVEHVPPAGGRP
jgi:hypothetical protein